jgi:hypothetical protein
MNSRMCRRYLLRITTSAAMEGVVDMTVVLRILKCACLIVFVAAISMAGASIAQTGPTLFHEGPGGAPLQPDPNACWSEPPDLNGLLLTSEQILAFGFECEVANDFTLDGSRTITMARWWGGYYNNTVPCEAGITPPGFYLSFYENADCLPLQFPHYNPYAEFFISGSAGEVSVGCQQGTFPLFRYEADVSVPVTGGVTYWFGVQMADHSFPPQWGRLGAAAVTGCESAMWIHTLDWPEWDPVTWILGFPADFSQEFECESIVPVRGSTWGRIKGLYR